MNEDDKKIESTETEMPAGPVDAKGMADGMSLGINLMVSIGLGAFAGYWMDDFAETKGIFLILFGILGFAAGMMQIWRTMNK